MRIPERHCDGLVSKNLPYVVQIRAVHHEPRRAAMTKIVKSKVLDLRFLQRCSKRVLHILDCFPCLIAFHMREDTG